MGEFESMITHAVFFIQVSAIGRQFKCEYYTQFKSSCWVNPKYQFAVRNHINDFYYNATPLMAFLAKIRKPLHNIVEWEAVTRMPAFKSVFFKNFNIMSSSTSILIIQVNNPDSAYVLEIFIL